MARLPLTLALAVTTFALLAACGGGGGDAPPAGGPETVFFSIDIQPLFNAQCIHCHGGAGGLDLQSHAGVIAGGVTPGGVVNTNDANQSLIIRRLDGRVTPQMPTDSSAFSQNEIDLIETWISEGARDN